MVRHGSVDEVTSGDATVETEGRRHEDTVAEAAESADSWLGGWKLPMLSDVVSKTSSVMHQTVQQTSSVVCSCIGHSCLVVSASDCGVRGPRFESHSERLCLL